MVWMVECWFSFDNVSWIEAVFDSPVKAGELAHAIVSKGEQKRARVIRMDVK